MTPSLDTITHPGLLSIADPVGYRVSEDECAPQFETLCNILKCKGMVQRDPIDASMFQPRRVSCFVFPVELQGTEIRLGGF